jgi:hypothetical protein
MSTEMPSPSGRLTPSSFIGKISRRGSRAQKIDDASPNPGGLLVPRDTSRSSDSEESRSIRSNASSQARKFFRQLSTRGLQRSPSSVALDGQTPPVLKPKDFKNGDINSWKDGFRKYNQLVTNQISKDTSEKCTKDHVHSPKGCKKVPAHKSKDFLDICKILTKECDKDYRGRGFVHGLPEAMFDLALLWCPTGHLTREAHPSSEPSWSWTGWDGTGVNFPLDISSCPDLPRRDPEKEGKDFMFKSEVKNYWIGPEEDRWEIRREKKDPLRIAYPSHYALPTGEKRPVDKTDTLQFEAFTISAEGFTTEQLRRDNDEHLAASALMDDKKHQCGVVMDYNHLISINDDRPRVLEFVLLSRNFRCVPPEHMKRGGSNTAHPPKMPVWENDAFSWDSVLEEFDPDHFQESEWCMLNVMLIEHQAEGWAERVAIATIHEDVWKAAGPKLKPVVLR